jgi:hypothetical protein
MSPARNGGPWPGLVDAVPDVFASCVNEPAFSFHGEWEATVCLWRQTGDDRWYTGAIELPAGDDPDGADWLFAVLLDPTPVAYVGFAEDYYDTDVSSEAVAEILAYSPLNDRLVQHLNPQATLNALAHDLSEIGYPSSFR